MVEDRRGKGEGGRSLTHLAEQSQEFKTPAIDFELGRAGEAEEAVRKAIEEIRQVLSHGERRALG